MMNYADLFGAFIGFILTLIVLSYAWGETSLFRFVMHLFVGVAAGYIAIVAIHNILLPQLILPIFQGNRNEVVLAVIYLIPCALILMKLSPQLSRLGNPAMAILVGIGAAAAIGGSIFGTIFPQVNVSTKIYQTQNFINASVIILGTLSTLVYFHFGIQGKHSNKPIRNLIKSISWVGQIFIALTFGTLFTGVFYSALTAMIERLSSIISFIREIIGLVSFG
jgi:hypothetical protein